VSIDNFIHPTSIVGPGVKLGANNYIGPFCHITGNVEIGNGNRFESHVSIGTPAQHRAHFKEYGHGKIEIGHCNVIREFCTINAPIADLTKMGNDCLMMTNSHLSHDSILEDDVTLANNVDLAGHVYVMKNATFGLGVSVHQYQIIGSYSMIGMNASIDKNLEVLPGGIYVGNPARFLKTNKVGLYRNNISPEEMISETSRYNEISLQRCYL